MRADEAGAASTTIAAWRGDVLGHARGLGRSGRRRLIFGTRRRELGLFGVHGNHIAVQPAYRAAAERIRSVGRHRGRPRTPRRGDAPQDDFAFGLGLAFHTRSASRNPISAIGTIARGQTIQLDGSVAGPTIILRSKIGE